MLAEVGPYILVVALFTFYGAFFLYKRVLLKNIKDEKFQRDKIISITARQLTHVLERSPLESTEIDILFTLILLQGETVIMILRADKTIPREHYSMPFILNVLAMQMVVGSITETKDKMVGKRYKIARRLNKHATRLKERGDE